MFLYDCVDFLAKKVNVQSVFDCILLCSYQSMCPESKVHSFIRLDISLWKRSKFNSWIVDRNLNYIHTAFCTLSAFYIHEWKTEQPRNIEYIRCKSFRRQTSWCNFKCISYHKKIVVLRLCCTHDGRCIHFISSPELKAGQMNLSDHLSSSICLWTFQIFIFFFSRTPKPVSNKLGEKYLWVKGI